MKAGPALGLVAFLAGLVPACQSAPPGGQQDAEQAIVAQERRALEQWAQGNPLGYLDIDADDVTYFDDIGAHSRVDGIGAVRTYLTTLKGKIPPHRYELLDPKVQLYGDIGILTLRYDAYGTAAQPVSRWKATSVYRRTNGHWRIVHAHWSLVKDGEADRRSSP
jgi:ketosteroid isomerase-like protein